MDVEHTGADSTHQSRVFVEALGGLVADGYFSCSIDAEVQANGAVRYFEGASGVYATILGPQVMAKKNDEACRTI